MRYSIFFLWILSWLVAAAVGFAAGSYCFLGQGDGFFQTGCSHAVQLVRRVAVPDTAMQSTYDSESIDI
ncbi:MAG: hypothetical protein OYG31_02025 [Candidatus Kaiserbacteria bacterium]|nr:hypothetical protein [Candidatus Kaiserbacteria bacterium]